jgi:hypothetical protein
MGYKGEEMPFTIEQFNLIVPTSPKTYRDREQFELNEMRTAAGIPPKTIYNKVKAKDIKNLLANAGM